ncbi:hypothetical protein BCR34DRAFT_589967 [Clohesyomyces aquaticus]|uniref:Uncharacterized protein n=1 Tax=Clohesyomyces aquaticus TaxID=1231657 RepID=A0A1Y1ZE04_9PLEO|nr:hypothetical protein BCR34DRAFT_589967 [Clohesyomyces aquaticus]
MAFRLIHRMFVISLGVLSAVCAIPKDDFPYALTFGPTMITASQWRSPGDIKAIIFTGGHDYISYFNDAIANSGKRFSVDGKRMASDGDVTPPPEIHDMLAVTSIFRNEIGRLSRNISATSKLGHEPQYSSVFYPRFLNYSPQSAIYSAVFYEGSLNEKMPSKYGFLGSTAAFAYGLDNCTNCGQTDSKCVPEDDCEDLIYHSRRLLEYQTFPVTGGRFSQDFGEESGRKMREDIGNEAYNLKLYEFLKNFAEKYLSQPWHGKVENINAIVVFGEASKEVVADLQDLARDAVGIGVVKAMDVIDPLLAAPYGAAMYARDTAMYPEEYSFWLRQRKRQEMLERMAELDELRPGASVYLSHNGSCSLEGREIVENVTRDRLLDAL